MHYHSLNFFFVPFSSSCWGIYVSLKFNFVSSVCFGYFLVFRVRISWIRIPQSVGPPGTGSIILNYGFGSLPFLSKNEGIFWKKFNIDSIKEKISGTYYLFFYQYFESIKVSEFFGNDSVQGSRPRSYKWRAESWFAFERLDASIWLCGV